MTRDSAYYLERLADLSWLCRLEADEGRTVMDSSLNQRHGPRDCNFFLREEAGGWKVLVDYEGAGCLTRFWTAGDFDGDLEIYLDGGARPAVRTTLRQLYSGELPPFLSPLVRDCPDSSMGRVSYLPIPFARGCKVRSRSDTGSYYWQINAMLYGDGDVATFDPVLDEAAQKAMGRVRGVWGRDNGYGAAAGGGSLGDARGAHVPARGQVVLLELEGGGRIDELRFRATDPSALARLALRVHWDGSPEPAVDAPLAHLACQGSKARPFASLFARCRDGEVALALPMPFAAGARLVLANPSTAPASVVWRAALTGPTRDTALRFHCHYRNEVLPYGAMFPLLRVAGRAGRFVGLAQVSRQLGTAAAGCFQQEGNEYAYVDGEQDPSWRGTGTEDYFNCAYFYGLGEVATPTHGCLDQTYSPTGAAPAGLVSAYRWHVLDSIPFRQSLVLLQEAGCPRKGALVGVNGRETLLYEWVCPHYAAPAETAPAEGDGTRASARITG